MDLAINVTTETDWQVIVLKGELDDYQTSKLSKAFEDVLDVNTNQKVILNLNDVSFIDSVGLGTIAIAGKKIMLNKDGQFNLVCNQKKLVHMIELSGITNIGDGKIRLFSNLEDALSS